MADKAMNADRWVLQYCPECIQMTNHGCLKCAASDVKGAPPSGGMTDEELRGILLGAIQQYENHYLREHNIQSIARDKAIEAFMPRLRDACSRPLRLPGEEWINVKERMPDTLPGKDYSANVLTTDGKQVYVMAWCYVQEADGFLWGNCYGDIDGDPKTDDEYADITHWRPIPIPPPHIRQLNEEGWRG